MFKAIIILKLKISLNKSALIQISASGLIEVINSYRIYGASLGLTPIATKKSYFDDVNTITANANNWDQTSNYSENVAQGN